MTDHRPETVDEASEVLRAVSADGATVTPRGAGTKSGWGRVIPAADVEICTDRLNAVVEYNHADMTAVLQSGVRLDDARATFAEKRQRLALDPPLGAADGATVGGIFSTADSGPLRHRYGAPRDLVLGMTVILADGTVARAGGKVIKNVAGYDLAKLFTGAFGTLGLIAEVIVRLHPLPDARVTARGTSDDPTALQRGAMAVSHARLQPDCLDVTWRDGSGSILVRFAGAAAAPQAEVAAGLLRDAGLETSLVDDDDALWGRQRDAQRSADGATLKVSGLQGALADVVRAADRRGSEVAGRASAGLYWLRLPAQPDDRLVRALEDLRADLREFPSVVQDAPSAVREKVDVWGEQPEPVLGLFRRLKQRFDPDGRLNPGIYLGGL